MNYHGELNLVAVVCNSHNYIFIYYLLMQHCTSMNIICVSTRFNDSFRLNWILSKRVQNISIRIYNRIPISILKKKHRFQFPPIFDKPFCSFFSMSFMQMSIPQELQLDQAAYSKTVQLVSDVWSYLLFIRISRTNKMFQGLSWKILLWITIMVSLIFQIHTRTGILLGCHL